MEEKESVTQPEVVLETIINENLLEVLEVITENPILVKEKRGKKMDTYNKLEWLTFAIQESINGFIVNNEKEFIEKLKYMLFQREWDPKIINKSVMSKFNQDDIIKQYERMFEKVLAIT